MRASMRPRPLSRGNRLAWSDGAPMTMYRFNEAAAVKPRKLTAVEAGKRSEKCFNEAAAVKPRKRPTIHQ